MFRIWLDDSDWQGLLDAHEYPNAIVTESLNGVFGALAEDVRARIPILTGSLLNSEKVDSGPRAEEWEGSLTYGGASAGPKPEVVYAPQALYHSAAYDGLEHYDDPFIEAMFESVNTYVSRRP